MSNALEIKQLRALGDSLKGARTLLAWLDLKESERRSGDPPILIMDTQLAWDIWNEQSRFMSLAAEFHDALNDAATAVASNPDIEAHRRELLKLEAQFQSLALPKTL